MRKKGNTISKTDRPIIFGYSIKDIGKMVTIFSILIGGGFKFGMYYQQSRMERNETIMIRDYTNQYQEKLVEKNNQIYQCQKENLALQDTCIRLRQEIRELTFYINRKDAKKR